METIVVALITGVMSLIGVVITNNASNKRQEETFKGQVAVIQNDIKHLTDEVHQHNNFAQKIPILEERIKNLTKRIEDLEKQDN